MKKEFIKMIKNGPYNQYENRKLWEKGIYKNNKLNGPYKIYDCNGKLWEKGIYKNNKLNGPYKIYDCNGKLCEEGIYEIKQNKQIFNCNILYKTCLLILCIFVFFLFFYFVNNLY